MLYTRRDKLFRRLRTDKCKHIPLVSLVAPLLSSPWVLHQQASPRLSCPALLLVQVLLLAVLIQHLARLSPRCHLVLLLLSASPPLGSLKCRRHLSSQLLLRHTHATLHTLIPMALLASLQLVLSALLLLAFRPPPSIPAQHLPQQ